MPIPSMRGNKGNNRRRRPARAPIELVYTKPLQVGARQVTIRTNGVANVGLAVFANTPPNFPWYDAETKDNLAVNASGEVNVTVNIRAVGDRIKAFASTGPAARDFTNEVESDLAEAAPGGTAPPPVGTGNAATVFAKMGLGINQERYTAVGHQNARTSDYYQYYRDMGIRNVRFFIPVTWDNPGENFWTHPEDQTADTISGYLDAVQACLDSGMPVVHLDGCGVIGSWHVYNESDGARVSDREDRMGQLNAYIQMFGAAVAARNFPVDRFIVGAINEYGGGRNEDWQPDRFRWNGYLRAAMPNHTIVDGPANWKDPRALWNDQGIGSTPFVKWSDANNIIDCHHYLGWGVSPGDGMDWVGGKIKEWSVANGRGVYMGEYGFDEPTLGDQSRIDTWISRFDAETQYENVCLTRPCLWCVTDGNAWRMNELTDAGTNQMRPGMFDAVKRWAGRVDTRIASASPLTPTQPAEPPQGSDAALNILVRGQSNVQLFCDRGGVWRMRDRIQTATGRTVNIIASYGNGGGPYTIWSGTEFFDWINDGKQSGLVQIHQNLSATQKAAPFVEVWMHNESDQKEFNSYTTADWVSAVRNDAALMRQALGLTASQHLRYFVPIRYPYGDITKIRNGMDQLAADASFNARVSMAAWSAVMDGDGGDPPAPNSNHMGDQDALNIGDTLAAELSQLFPSGGAATPGGPSAPPTPPPASTRDIVFTPEDPAGDATWNTTLAVTGISRVAWVIQNDGSHSPPWSFENAVEEVDVPGNGQVPITVNFNKNGQFVLAYDTADNTFTRYSASFFGA